MTRFFLFVVACAAILMGCEENLARPEGTERAFSLYGVLTPRSDTQWVHVFPIEETLRPSAPGVLDVEIVSTELQTGETKTWRDSLIQDANGDYGHVFWAPFQARYEHRYRIRAVSENRGESSVEVTVPPKVEPRKGEPSTTGNVTLPLHLEGTAPRFLRMETLVWVRYVESLTQTGPITTLNWAYPQFALPFEDRLSRTDKGWSLEVDLTEAYQNIWSKIAPGADQGLLRQHGIQLLLVRFRMLVANEEWNPPGGTFDSLLIVQPEVMTNVENGFGFVGAGYELRESWQPTDDVAEAAGFRALQ